MSWELKSYRFVGWFAADPLDISTIIFPSVGKVTALNKSHASEQAYDLLIMRSRVSGKELLNWYVERVGVADGSSIQSKTS